MIDQELRLRQSEPAEEAPFRRIEPDWTESEWFQVWLQLARHPYHDAGATATDPTRSDTKMVRG